MDSGAAFTYSPGKHEYTLCRDLPLRLRAATNGLRSHLDPESWRAAHESGLGYVEMVFAADGLFRFAYIAPSSDAREAAAFLAAQLVLCGDHNQADPANETSFVTVPAFHRAAAAVRWAHEGSVSAAALETAARVREAGRARLGGLQAAIDSVPRDGGWQRGLAVGFSADFVTHAVLGDWAWVDDAAQRGFLYLDSIKAPSADGLLIQFFRKLSACVGLIRTTGDVGQAREALNRCADSWASSVIAGQPWDAGLSI